MMNLFIKKTALVRYLPLLLKEVKRDHEVVRQVKEEIVSKRIIIGLQLLFIDKEI